MDHHGRIFAMYIECLGTKSACLIYAFLQNSVPLP
jgi:hypothetical protein